MQQKRVMIGFLGSKLDGGSRPKRWERWRPSIAACRQPDLAIERLDLLVDNHARSIQETVREDLALVAPHVEVRMHPIDIRDSWDFAEMYGALRDFADGYGFDPENEEYLVNITTGTHTAQICWFMLTETRHVPGRLLQLSPIGKNRDDVDHIGKHRIIDLDLSQYDAIRTRFNVEQADATSFLKSGIATKNSAFNRMIDEIEKVAIRSKAPVLLTGPTGAGKSQLARRIHELKLMKRQVTGAFVEVNCATLRGDQAMSSLFGHIRGAFTGAMAPRKGLLKEAEGGVLFLDEIGELGLDEQAMILRAIEEKRFFPVGSDKEVSSNFQLIAGTNRDLNDEARHGRFRGDLLARLNLWSFRMPSLADRREDIEPNLDYEIQRITRVEGRSVSFNKEARDAYLAFSQLPTSSWDANFRDLSASIARMATLAPNGRIDADTVETEIQRLKSQWGASTTGDGLENFLEAEVLAELDMHERAALAVIVSVCRQSRSLSEAGRILFAASRERKTSGNDADRLRKHLARHGLSFDALRYPTEDHSVR